MSKSLGTSPALWSLAQWARRELSRVENRGHYDTGTPVFRAPPMRVVKRARTLGGGNS